MCQRAGGVPSHDMACLVKWWGKTGNMGRLSSGRSVPRLVPQCQTIAPRYAPRLVQSSLVRLLHSLSIALKYTRRQTELPLEFLCLSPTTAMSTIGFIIDGVRHGSFIAPQWFPDAGMTVWMFLSEMKDGDAARLADNLRGVQWCVAAFIAISLKDGQPHVPGRLSAHLPHSAHLPLSLPSPPRCYPHLLTCRIPDDNTHFLRRPLDVLRDLRDGRCPIMPEHAWRLWSGTQRWAYFVVGHSVRRTLKLTGRTLTRWSTRSGGMDGSS